MRRLRVPLWSLRRARRDITLAQPANGRAGEDDGGDLDEAEVGDAVDMNGHGDNDVGDMGSIMVASYCYEILVPTQSSEKEGAKNRNSNIVSRQRPGSPSEYKDSRIIVTIIAIVIVIVIVIIVIIVM